MMSVKDWLGSADNLTAFMVATVILWRSCLEWYRRNLGAKRDLRRKLNTVACGNPVEYIESMFGAPVYRTSFEVFARRSRERENQRDVVEQRLYRAKYGWLTVHFIDEAVVAYAFTLTSRRFRYNLGIQSRGQLHGELGRLPLTEVNNVIYPESGELFVGASTYGYTEVSFFGRPGVYQFYALSVTMIGWRKHPFSFAGRAPVIWGRFDKESLNNPPSVGRDPHDDEVARLRREAEPDTFTVFANDYIFEMYGDIGASGGIDHDRLMLLDKPSKPYTMGGARRHR